MIIESAVAGALAVIGLVVMIVSSRRAKRRTAELFAASSARRDPAS